jgi:hypothetical protein
MRKYKDISFMEGDYFSPPKTMSKIVESRDKKRSYYERDKIDMKDYKKSTVTKRSFKLYEK